VLSGALGVSQAFLARWYIGGGYMDVPEVVVFYDCSKIYVQNSTSILNSLVENLLALVKLCCRQPERPWAAVCET